jgi:hypothetical protein
MSSKEQTHSNDKATAKQRTPQPNVKDVDILTQQRTHPATIVQRARLDPGSLFPRDVMQLQYAIGNRAVIQVIQRSPEGKLAAKAMAAPATRQVNCHHTVMAWLREAGILSKKKFNSLFQASPTADAMIDTLTQGRVGPKTRDQLQSEAAGKIVVFQHGANLQHSMVIPMVGFIAGVNNAGVHIRGGGEYQLFRIKDLNWRNNDGACTEIEHPQNPGTYYNAYVSDIANIKANLAGI